MSQWQCVSALDEDDCNKVHIPGWEVWMDIRGLGLASCRTLWTGAGFCSETALEKFSFWMCQQASVNFYRSSLENNLQQIIS